VVVASLILVLGGNLAFHLFLAVTVLAVNMLGDGLRDTLDPRIRQRL
jgi:ABC-type dipeptide/oligopeptide/nickel transport system permease subunit